MNKKLAIARATLKRRSGGRPYDRDEAEVALAFLSGELSYTQAASGLGVKDTNVSTTLLSILRSANMNGALQLQLTSK